MIMNKKIIVLLLVLVSICAISHVSAVDDNATELAVDDINDIETQSIDEMEEKVLNQENEIDDDILSEGDKELQE